MKKSLLLFLSIFLTTQLYAMPFHRIAFFGDSLSDNGNLYQWLLHIIPKSPPYFRGRFSNGETWSEDLGQYYYHRYYISYKIYAVAGATAIYHSPNSRFISPSTLSMEIERYFLDALFKNKKDYLFVLWIGGNDYLFDDKTDPNLATDKVVVHIYEAMQTLIKAGGINFVILNLPDLSKIPFARNNGLSNRLNLMSQLHNLKLSKAMDKLKATYPGIKIILINIYDMFNDMMVDPEKYNKKYGMHIKNVTEACWTGGFLLSNALLQSNLRKALVKKQCDVKPTHLTEQEVQNLTQLILVSPALRISYQPYVLMEKKPCPNVDEYLFWDDIHPTEAIHKVLAKLAAETIDLNILNQ